MKTARYARQEGLINMDKVKKTCVTVVGMGAVGSFSTLALGKMGIDNFVAYDIDGVSEHNLPNQFYRDWDVGQFKINATQEILSGFASNVKIKGNLKMFSGKEDGLGHIVIAATDNMKSRKAAWNAWKKSFYGYGFIDARMGGELARIYTIRKRGGSEAAPLLTAEDRDFYEEALYPDSKTVELKCAERAIIYNVLIIAGLVSRGVKALVESDVLYPREITFDMKNMLYLERK